MQPRSYQLDAKNAIFKYFVDNAGNPLVVMPTGTGKSIVIGDFTRTAIQSYPGTRVMMLTHVKELIEQNLEKLLKLWPNAPAGLYSSGLGRKDSYYPVTFGGVGTVAKVKDFRIFGRVDLLLIDEAHLVSPKDETMYGKVIAALREINPKLKVIGFTATDFRLGHGRLTEGDHLFTDVCIDMSKRESFNWFISQGYLVPLIPKRPKLEIDPTGIHTRGGEYIESEAQAAVDKDEITYAACKEMIDYGQDRKKWLVFASGVQHTEHVHSMLTSLGVNATFVHSKISDKERDQRIADFKKGKYQAIVNNGILTTGFDDPEIDMIAMLRLTLSPGLWVQMLGRGTRPVYAPGFDLMTKEGRLASIAASQKHNCLVLDFAGNTRRLGPINDPVIPRPKGKAGGEAPVKICEECGTYCHASVRFCDNCGAEFPKHVKIRGAAYTDELIAKDADQPVTQNFNVDTMTYAQHYKEGRPPSIKVTYYSGVRRFSEYICLEHVGYPQKRARDWWRAASGSPDGIPDTVAEAMTKLDLLRKPRQIKVWINKPNPEIINHEYI
jgi:DNA repair protein RadD